MSSQTLSWSLVDRIADDLGVSDVARRKWRQGGRSVPSKWRIRIVETLLKEGVPVALSDFDRLPPCPGRLAA